MSGKSDSNALADIPRQVIGKFLDKLTGAGVSADVVARLRKTLIDDSALTEPAVKRAIFPEDAS